MLGHHGRFIRRQGAHHVRRRIVEIEHRCMRIRGIDAGHFFERVRTPGVNFFQNFHDGELYIGGCKRFTIVPSDAFAQVECHGFTIGGSVIAFSQNRDHFTIIIVIKKTIINFWSKQANRA